MKTDDIINSNEYYLDQENNEYFSCKDYNNIQNCKKCNNKNICELCEDGYTFIDDNVASCKNIEELGNKYIKYNNKFYKKCSSYINNCETCLSNSECLSCIEDYGLYNDKTKCIKINEQEHYEKNGLYYLCNTGVSYCEKCSAYNICNRCEQGYIRVNNDNSICILKNNINMDEYYNEPKDDNMYLKCSSYISNCISCEYLTGCKSCRPGYIFLNDNFKNCFEKKEISLSNYYTNDNITYYSCNDYRYRNDIRCFSLVPKQDIILSFVQAQLIYNKLHCYMITHSPLPQGFSLKSKIKIYNKKIRNLQDSIEREIVLTTNDDSDGSKNKLVSFISNEEFNNLGETEKNIQIKDIQFNNDNSITQTVTSSNNCLLNFDKNSDLTDTGTVEAMIQAKKIPNCNTIQQEDIIDLNINKIEGCEFNLYSQNPISFSDNKLDLELYEYENSNNKILAECNTKELNIKKINCKINEEKEIDNNYSFKEGLISESNKFITISTNENKFKILCNQKNSNSQKKIIIAVSVCSSIIVVTIIILIVIIIKKKNNINPVPSKSISINKKSITSSVKSLSTNDKLETQNYQDKEDNNDILKVNKKNKTKKKKEKEKKEKKNKSKKNKD